MPKKPLQSKEEEE